MRGSKTVLLCPNLSTKEDFAKQREKSRSDFEQFVERRNSEKAIHYFGMDEKKRM